MKVINEQLKRDVYKMAYGKEFDDPKRKQHPLPINIAYKVAYYKLKREGRL